MGHPEAIVEVSLLRQVGIGFSLLGPANGRVNLLIVVPFFMISVEFMWKNSQMGWIAFHNMFND